MSKQKEKGKYFERQIAKKIQTILCLKENECIRSPNSGNGEYEFGDIYFSNPHAYPFCIECKFGYDWDIRTIFPKLNKQLSNFLEQAEQAKDKMVSKLHIQCKLCCVILSKPYYPTYVITKDYIESIPNISTRNQKDETVYLYDFNSLINEFRLD